MEIIIIGQPIGMGCTHTVIRLHYHRIAHLINEGFAAVKVVHKVIPCRGNANLLVVLLHLGLVLDSRNIYAAEAGVDVEIVP